MSSDSPSSMVTTRRGSPIRRAIAVAATASGGATTAPSANAAAQVRPGTTACTTSADADRGEGDQADREQQDRPPVGVEVDQRGLQRGGVEQRRQEPHQHHLGGQAAPRGRRAGRTLPAPRATSTSGAGRSNLRERPATAMTTDASTARVRAKCTHPLFRKPPSASGLPSRAPGRRACPAPSPPGSDGARRRSARARPSRRR